MARTNLAFAAMRYRPLRLGKKSGEEFRALLIAKSKIGCKITIFFGQFQIIYRKFAFYTTLLTLRRVRRRLPMLVQCLCADYKHDNRTNPSDLRFPLAFRLLLPTFRQRARITVLPPLCRMPQCHRQVIEETFSHLIGSYGYILYGR